MTVSDELHTALAEWNRADAALDALRHEMATLSKRLVEAAARVRAIELNMATVAGLTADGQERFVTSNGTLYQLRCVSSDNDTYVRKLHPDE